MTSVLYSLGGFKNRGVIKNNLNNYVFDFLFTIFMMIPYMNTTTHGCDHEGSCKISTVLLLKSCH